MTEFQKLIKYLALALAAVLIVGICGGLLTVFNVIDSFVDDGADVMNTMADYPLTGTVTELEINIGAAELIIANGEKFSLSANLKDLEVEQQNGCLTIRETVQLSKNRNNAQIRLTVPEAHVFERLTVSSGAGRLQVSVLSAQSLALHLGAGQAVFRQLNAQRGAVISTGAGELIVEGGTLADLDLDMGVGKVTLKSRLTGDCEVDQGVGEAVLALLGEAADYTVHVEKGLGSATVDGKNVANDTVCGSGPARVDIDGGVGSIRVSFTEE